VAALTAPIYGTYGVAAAFSILGPRDRLAPATAQNAVAETLKRASIEMSLELAGPGQQ
jgi:DNA-binding IclR family transcriptional regulator